MRTVDRIQGRSLPLNVIFVLLNLVGLVFLTMGYHKSAGDAEITYKVIGSIAFFLGLGGLVLMRGIQLSSFIFRAITGGLFIVSGLIKANDPLGFAYKLEEYFEDGALAYRIKELFGAPEFSLEFLIDYALPLSIFICILEIVLGVLLIIGGKLRLTSFFTLGLMIFFTLLTWHTKECDPTAYFTDVDRYEITNSAGITKQQMAATDTMITVLEVTDTHILIEEQKATQCVSDCGCFGDALKGSVGRSLSPNESFWKDLILLYLSLIIFIASFRSMPNTRNQNLLMVPASLIVTIFFSSVFGWYFPIVFSLITTLGALWVLRSNSKYVANYLVATLWIVLICALFVGYVSLYLPVKDYRPYAVGNDLKEKMRDGVPGEFETILVYKNLETGKNERFTMDEFNDSKIWSTDKDKWDHVATETTAIRETKLASIDSSEFNPNLSVTNLTEVEKQMPFVQEILSKNQIEMVELIDKATGDVYPQNLAEFYPADWDTTAYRIGDTIKALDPALKEVSAQPVILNSPRMILVVSKDLGAVKLSDKRKEILKSVVEDASKEGVQVVMAAVATKEQIEAFRAETGIEIPTFINDEKILKAVARANPSVMVIESGIVKVKYPILSLQKWEWIKENALED